ncbi:MAG: isoprenoid biosynthesis glyoxalase ElbB [Alphaproteobacteria bacterium]|nr:isoprenoid biosynthesis glyoxalase ElbB [Alphaproteobacteria bacterium]
MSKNVAIILAGCGAFDGSEVHEATLSLLALDQMGAHIQCFAPDIDQMHVINHVTGEKTDEKRNVLVESARIARGNIKPLSAFTADSFDAMLLPGGFGAAKNLCDFGVLGAECSVNEQVEEILCAMQKKGKPIAALCISPVILARVFEGAKVTLGADGGAAQSIVDGMNAQHEVTTHGQITVDDTLNLVTGPCYMLDSSISQVYDNVVNVVKELLDRA